MPWKAARSSGAASASSCASVMFSPSDPAKLYLAANSHFEKYTSRAKSLIGLVRMTLPPTYSQLAAAYQTNFPLRVRNDDPAPTELREQRDIELPRNHTVIDHRNPWPDRDLHR